MPKDSGANGDAPRPVDAHEISPPPPPYSRHPAPRAAALGDTEIRGQQRIYTMSPPSALPAVSLHDTESLLMRADVHAEQLHQLSRQAQRYLRHYNKANLALEEVLLLRSTVIHVRNQGFDQRRFVFESQESFLQEAQVIIDALANSGAFIPEITLDKLRTLHDQVQRDHKHRSQHVQRTQDIEKEIGDKEFIVQKSVLRLAEDAKAMNETLTTIDLPDVPSDNLSAPSTVTEAEAEKEDKIPILVQHYFEKLGDVNNEKDNLMNLEFEHQESRLDRMARVDQGRPPSMTDEEFENAFTHEYEEAQIAYNRAAQKADLARAVCIGEDINPDDYRRLPSETEKDDSQGIPSVAAAAASNASSSGKVVRAEFQVPTTEPVFEQLVLGPNSIYPAWRAQGLGTASPVEERLHTWLQDQLLPDPWEHVEARRRSLSEARKAALSLNDNGSVDRIDTTSQSQKRQRHRNLPPVVRRLVGGHDEDERPVLLKRPSSETDLFLLPSQHQDRDQTFNNLREFTIHLPGQNPRDVPS